MMRLINRNRLQCPECRAEHEAKKEERNFPQNKYILILLNKQSSVLKDDTSPVKKCAKHNKDEMFFCGEKGCQQAICPSCLSANHLGHKVVEIQEKKQEVLEIVLKKAENVSQILDQKIKKVTNTQTDTIKKAETNINKLKKKKEEVIEKFDQMIKGAEDQMQEMKTATDGEIKAMKENLDISNNVKQSIATENESSYEDILEQLDTVSKITGKVRNIFCGKKTYSYSEYAEAENLYLGEIIKKEITINLRTHFQGIMSTVRYLISTGIFNSSLKFYFLSH